VKLLSFNTTIQETSNLTKKPYQETGDLGSIKEADNAKLEFLSDKDRFSEESKSIVSIKKCIPMKSKVIRPKVQLKIKNADINVSMFKHESFSKPLSQERSVPFRPISISPVIRRPLVPPLENKLMQNLQNGTRNL